MSVTIALESDEALVLFEALASGQLTSADAPVRNTLSALHCLLESKLVEPLSPQYKDILHSARASVVARGGN